MLVSGDFLFGNASSQHQTGKAVSKEVSRIKSQIYQAFSLSEDSVDLFFHSGATEAFNTFFNLKKGDAFFYFPTDHGAIHALAQALQERGVFVKCLEVNNKGLFDVEKIIKDIQKASYVGNAWLNYTQLNNETGIEWDLSLAVRIKEQTKVNVHVDAVQVLGKIEKGFEIEKALDAYSYSGHKIGALKGIGFSFVKKSLNLRPLIIGGGQQGGLRSGTINSHGIFSLGAALSDLCENDCFQKLKSLKEELVAKIDAHPQCEVIQNNSSNTICFLHNTMRSDMMLIHFDLAGLDVSAGSACSSGSFSESKVLKAMGHHERANKVIRISLGFENLKEKEEILARLQAVLSKL